MNKIMQYIVWILLLYIVILISRKQRKPTQKVDIEYQEALLELEGKNFFCYNNKQDVQYAIEIVLIPQLAPNFEIIFLNGKNPESDYDEWLIKQILYNLKHYSKFPHLFKVRNGEIVELSINNEFYNTIDQKKPMNGLIQTIDRFFQD
jgi:hypothetical protein